MEIFNQRKSYIQDYLAKHQQLLTNQQGATVHSNFWQQANLQAPIDQIENIHSKLYKAGIIDYEQPILKPDILTSNNQNIADANLIDQVSASSKHFYVRKSLPIKFYVNNTQLEQLTKQLSNQPIKELRTSRQIDDIIYKH